ncbi:MAG: AAA family ATPase [Bacteroidota bacterium]
MKTNNADLSKLQAERFQLNSNLTKMSIENVFTDRKSSYINEFNLYIAYFNTIPNVVSEINIDCRSAHRWFIDNFKDKIKDTYYNKRFLQRYKATELDDIFHFLDEDLIVDFDTNNSIVRFLYRKTKMENVSAIIDSIKKFKQKRTRNKPMMSLLVCTKSGIEIKSLELNRTKLNIRDNYNEDFTEIHQTIMKRLAKKNDKGLVILHGKPGTGKTSYIRYLISVLKKDVIFLPPNMASAITNPDLISVLIGNPNSILVIEDAENIVMDREKDGGSPVSALLNISDGLLADCLNIQVICSFNTDISKVDSALMRKGRLIAKYEFKELELTKTRQLSRKLGFETLLNEPMVLAAIYNQSEKDFLQKKNVKSIGFRVSA